ncbi:MAG: DMT family transporter [Puniceicoccaceae bacterium]|nr:DMT family transporter [Puniceicoccaceae bacterium]MBL6838088.1 DMT family transporter [Puniceicoccaceae bacterium]
MEIFHINALIVAIGYAVAAVFSKQALSKGAGTLRLSLMVNLIFIPVFAPLLLQKEAAIPWEQLHLPIITGVLFFAGQVFTFAAIRMGDVSLQTPMMGTKAVFAVLIAVIFGTESIGVPMVAAAVVAMVGVALLGFSGNGAERVGVSIGLALLSSLFFAGSDTMVGVFAQDFGVPVFLFVVIAVNALLSFGLIPFFKEPLRAIPKQAWPWMLAACLLMAGQALLLNYTLGRYQHVAEVNIIYSTRGLWSVVFGAIAIRAFRQAKSDHHGRIYIMRFTGALLMCVAIAILFFPQL